MAHQNIRDTRITFAYCLFAGLVALSINLLWPLRWSRSVSSIPIEVFLESIIFALPAVAATGVACLICKVTRCQLRGAINACISALLYSIFLTIIGGKSKLLIYVLLFALPSSLIGTLIFNFLARSAEKLGAYFRVDKSR